MKIFKNKLSQAERGKRNKELLLGTASGLMLGFSFPPFPFPYLMFVALVPYFTVIEKRKDLAEVNRFTYFVFLIFSIVALYWVGAWMPEADPFLMLGGTALIFFNPVLFLIPSSLYYFARKQHKLFALLLFPFFWGFYEYLYGLTDLRFSWLILGHGLSYFKNFIQIADVIGACGLSIIVVYINIFLFVALKKERRSASLLYLTLAISLFIIPIIYGSIQINNYKPSNKKIKVGLIQPDLNPWNKWKSGTLTEMLNIYFELSQEAIKEGSEIIIFPETALPCWLLSGSHTSTLNRIRNFVDSNNVFLLTGMPNMELFSNNGEVPKNAKKLKYSDYSYLSYNAVLGFQPEREKVETYGKIKLVPFGEHVPFAEEFHFLQGVIEWDVGISSWNVGRDTTIFSYQKSPDNAVKIGVVVCIESIYPDFIAQFVGKGAEFIAVVTNDSWYGDKSGPYQHKEIAVLRAVENRRSVVRSANGGISAIINPIGTVLKQTNMYERTYLSGFIELNGEITFYTKHPLLIQYVSTFISLLIVLLSSIKFIITKIKRNKE